jgi:hypothetical protein
LDYYKPAVRDNHHHKDSNSGTMQLEKKKSTTKNKSSPSSKLKDATLAKTWPGMRGMQTEGGKRLLEI